MSKMFKRVLSVVLAMMMVITLIPTTVFAAGESNAADAPKADVSVIGAPTLTAAEHNYMVYPSGDSSIDRPLDIAMRFLATESFEEAAAGPFAKWKTDFYISVDGLSGDSIVADGCYLAGNYGSYGWIVIPTDGIELEEGVSYPVVSAYDANLTYENICSYVKDFTAAIYISRDILEQNPDFTVTLSLKMTDPEDENNVITVGEPAVYNYDSIMYTARIGEAKFETFAEAIAAAQDGDTVTVLKAGTYTLPSSISGKDITLVGSSNGDTIIDVVDKKPNMGGANVTFENLTFNYSNANYTGLQHAGELTYNNCVFNGQPFLYGTKETFNGCTFNQTSANAYNVWTYNGKEVLFSDCTFNSAGKAVLIYHESEANKVTFENCELIASSPVSGKAAIEIDTSLVPAGTEINIDADTTATGFDAGSVSGNSLWNDKKDKDNLVVYVDDKQVWPLAPVAKIGDVTYTSLQAAVDAASAAPGDYVIELLSDSCDEIVYITQKEGVNITITGDEDTPTPFYGVIDVFGDARSKGTETLTVKNLAFDKGANTTDSFIVSRGKDVYGKYSYAHNITVEGCTFTDSTNSRSIAAVRATSGGAGISNWSIIDCSADSSVHSLAQFTAIDGVTVSGCTVESKNGINLGSCNNIDITDNTIDVDGYTVRLGDSSGAGDVQNITLTDNVLTSAGDGGDSAIILRKSAGNANLTMTGNAVTAADGTSHISVSGATDELAISADENYWNPGSNPVVDGTDLEVLNYYKEAELINLVWNLDPVAKIGDVTYTFLQDAIDAAQAGDTIVMLTDVELTEGLVVAKGKDITLDLAGNDISRTVTETITKNDSLILNKGTLTITGEGTLTYGYTGEKKALSASTIMNEQGTLTIEDGVNIVNTTSNGTYGYGIDNLTNGNLGPATVNFNGGTIDSQYMGIRQFVNGNVCANTLNITGGEITALHRAVNAQDAQFNDASSAVKDALVLNIEGGVMTATGSAPYAVCIIGMSPNVSISGGEFTGWIWDYGVYYDTTDAFISGGTYDSEPEAGYIVEGFEAAENADGTYSIVEFAPAGDITYGAYNAKTSGEAGTEKYRENFNIDASGIKAKESLVFKLYSGETLIATTSLRESDRDDESVKLLPYEGVITANIVVAGRLAGSWDTDWIVAPSASYMPDKIELYADGILVDTWNGGFMNEENADKYVALPGVAKAASITDAEGNTSYYGSLADALAATESMEGDVTITLLDDVTWETGAGHGSTPLVSADSKAVVTIDGNGHTLTATGKGVGSLRAANGTLLTFKNMTIDDESVSYAEGAWEFTYLEFGGKLAFENVDFLSGIQLDSDNGTAPETAAVFTDCTFSSDEDSVYAVWVGNGSVEFNDCTFTGTRGLKVHEAYGSEVDSITVDGCVFDELTKKPGIALGTLNEATVITINDSTFNSLKGGDQNLYAFETDTPVGEFEMYFHVNNTINDSTTGQPVNNFQAQIGDYLYPTLADAVAAAEAGDTIILIDDATLTEKVVVPAGKEITLDLNGKTVDFDPAEWERATDGDALIVVSYGADLTITDSSAEQTGIIDASADENDVYAAVKMTDLGDDASNGNAALTVDGGTLKGSYYGICGNGNRNGTDITINDGTVTGEVAIFNPQDGTVTVNGGTVEGTDTGIEMRSGELVITDGTVKGGTGSSASGPNGSGTTVQGAAVAVSQHTTNNDLSVTVNGGNLEGYYALYEEDTADELTDNISMSVTGGTLTGKVESENVEGFITGGTFSEEPAEAYIAEGLEAVEGTDGWTIQQAKELFKFKSYRIILGNSLNLEFFFPKNAVEDWTGHYVYMDRAYADGRPHDIRIIPVEEWGTYQTDYYKVVYDKIAAKEMCDEITLMVCNAEGEPVSKTYTLSVRGYAMSVIKNATLDLERTAFVDMLNYGAEMQKYKGYNTDDLANSLLTEEQKAYATPGTVPVESTLTPGPNCKSIVLVNESNIRLRLTYQNITPDMYVVVDFINHYKQPVTARIEGSEFEPSGDRYFFYVEEMVVADARIPINVTVYNADGTVFSQGQVSVEDYYARAGANNAADIPLQQATIKFCDAAYAYLHRNDQ